MTVNDILHLALLQAVIVWGIDCTDFWHSVKRGLGIWTGWTPQRLRPFDCSLCASFWAGVLYIILAGLPWWTVALACIIPHFSEPLAGLLNAARDAWKALNWKINQAIDKVYEQRNPSDR